VQQHCDSIERNLSPYGRNFSTLSCNNCKFDASGCGTIPGTGGINIGDNQTTFIVYAVVAIVIIAVAGYWYYKRPKKAAKP